MKKVISTASIYCLTTVSDYLSTHIASLSDKVKDFIAKHEDVMTIMLDSLRKALTEAELITEVSSQRFWDTLMPLESVLDKIHFYVPSVLGASAGCSLDDSQIVMHVKPETVGCAEASKNRFNMDTRTIGAPEDNECKMLVFRVEKGPNKDQIYAFVLPGSTQINKELTKGLKLGVLDVQKLQDKYGIIPYTVNPFDFSSAVLSTGTGSPTYIHILRDQFQSSFITNNCGSRKISLSVNTALYFALVDKYLQGFSDDESSRGIVFKYGLPVISDTKKQSATRTLSSSGATSPASPSSGYSDSGIES